MAQAVLSKLNGLAVVWGALLQVGHVVQWLSALAQSGDVGRSGAAVHGAQGRKRCPLRLRHAGQAGDVQALTAAIGP